MIDYRIAGIRLRLELPCPLEEKPAFLPFRCHDDGKPDVTLTVTAVDDLTESDAPLLYETSDVHIRREACGLVRYFMDHEVHAPYAMLQELSPDHLHLFYGRRWQDRFRYPGNFFQRMGFENRLVQHGAFMLHASYIETPHGAILFTGPSGIGKSTQAALWEQHADAALVNGDRVALRCDDDTVTAWGLPYAGSSACYRNITLPVVAIVRLEQAPENALTRLSPLAAFHYLYEQSTVNVWDAYAVERATALIGAVCERVPVYHYACTKEADAVALLRAALFEESRKEEMSCGM